MPDAPALLAAAYDAFNTRDIDRALALMTEDVSWPKASEGGRVTGKAEIRAYWTRQWQDFDPRVTPLAILEHTPDHWHVRVHQLVRSLTGATLSDTEVHHHHTLTHGLIHRMDLGPGDNVAAGAPSPAFRHP